LLKEKPYLYLIDLPLPPQNHPCPSTTPAPPMEGNKGGELEGNKKTTSVAIDYKQNPTSLPYYCDFLMR